jgi:predicted PurR-regulated permease PerM
MDDTEAVRIAAEKASDWGSPIHVHALVLLALTGVGIYLCYWMAAPFFPALAWALALAVLFAPLNRWLERKFNGRSMAAVVCVIAAAVIVVVPALFVADRIAGEAGKGAATVTALVKSGEWRSGIEGHPRIESIVVWIDEEFDLPGLMQSAAAWLTSTATGFVRMSVLHLVGMILTFYLLFYFLRDRSIALASLRSLSPLSTADMNRLFVDVFETVHATVYGTFVVAAVQGVLGGLMFWWLGLPAPLLWGLVMGLLAVVPVLGAFIIWIPAALFLFATGSEGKALVLALWGTIVVGGIDNVLYPLLVGNSLKMHTIIAFVSIVGGMIFFGAAGLILGPIVFTVTRVLLQIWRARNAIAEA